MTLNNDLLCFLLQRKECFVSTAGTGPPFPLRTPNLCLCLFRVAKHSLRAFVLSCSLHIREKQEMLKVETLNGGLRKIRTFYY